jgi:SRSO17 transposase
MTPLELQQIRRRFEEFLVPLLAEMGRAERREQGQFYIQGLLLDGGRKTAATMAARYDGNEQALQQFVSQSPWAWEPVRQLLAQQMVALAPSGPTAWILDDTGFPKCGKHSVGVARQYSGTLGKIGNCQIGVSLNYATDAGAFPLDFQLYLPERWTKDRTRCQAAGISDDMSFQRKWEIALAMVDRALAWQVPVGVVITDAGYGVATEFRAGLRERDLTYVVGVTSDTVVWTRPPAQTVPPCHGIGRPPKAHWTEPVQIQHLAQALPEAAWQTITWREGTKGPMTGEFVAVWVEPAHDRLRNKAPEPWGWLLIEKTGNPREPFKAWLSNLPPETLLADLVQWAHRRWWVEQNYQQLKDELGLDHFEGRSWRGWHHHVTLTMIAFGFLVAEGFRRKKTGRLDVASSQTGAAEYSAPVSGLLSDLQATG